MYKLKSKNGRVDCLLRTGKDFVKHNLSVSAAQHIIDTGKLVKSEKENYPICVDNEWFFEGEEIVTEAPKKIQKNSMYGKVGK